MCNKIQIGLVLLAALFCARAGGQPPAQSAYLFSYFEKNGEDGLHLAESSDGLKWTPLNKDRSFVKPVVGSEKLMRDPCLMRDADGEFHMVWTTGWRGHDIGYAHSKDLIHWSKEMAIPVMQREPDAINCWAPEIVYDSAKQHFLIFWSSTIKGRFPQTDRSSEAEQDHRIYCTTTQDFSDFTPSKIFFDPGFSVIDATLLRDNDRYILFFKDERAKPEMRKVIQYATSDFIDGPFEHISPPFTPQFSEGPTAVKIGDTYRVYFDQYTKNAYGAMQSTDLHIWEDISKTLSMPPGARHGTVLSVPKQTLDALRSANIATPPGEAATSP